MMLSVLPLVLICVGLLVYLLTTAAGINDQQSAATATATATVTAEGDGSRGLDFQFADSTGQLRPARLVFPQAGHVPKGTTFTVHYVPGDPGRVYAGADELDLRFRNLVSGAQFALLVLLVGVLTTAFRLWRRIAAERRPAQTYPVRWAQFRRGLIRRSWLVVEDQAAKREWWLPVYWQPGLASLLAGTPCKVHGNPAVDRLVVVEVHGQPVWPAGRRRPTKPRRRKGDWIDGTVKWTKTAAKQQERDGGPELEHVPLVRHLSGDVALVLPARSEERRVGKECRSRWAPY